MAEELKQAAQQAISALQCAKRGHCDHAMADEAIAALERALTASQPAQATPEPVQHKCRHCGVTTIEDDDGVTMLGLPAPERPIMFDPSADVPIPAPPEPVGEQITSEMLAAGRKAIHETLGASSAGIARCVYESMRAARPASQQAAGEPVGYQRRDRNIVTGEWTEWREDDDIEEELDPEWAGRRPVYTHPAPGVPEIDYSALIHAAWGKHKYAQGTGGCIAFKRGAEWFRDIALAAAQAKGGEHEGI